MVKYRSFKGVPIDMDALIARNQDAVAVTGSGARLNARGDILGQGGVVRKHRKDIEEEYNRQLEGEVKRDTNVVMPDEFISPEEAYKQALEKAQKVKEAAAAPKAATAPAPAEEVQKPSTGRRKLIEDNDGE